MRILHRQIFNAIVILFFIPYQGIAQQIPDKDSNLPYRVLPSPTASELGKYGQVPVGDFTGTSSISVPLYTYKAGNISVPITLSYHSNGIKVDQLTSNVGLGWSLNCGGVISRTIRDLPDEDAEEQYPEDDIHTYGLYDVEAMDYFIGASSEHVDSEADEFVYNFPGHTGKFMYNNQNAIVKIPHVNLVIHSISNVLDDGFEIITDEGIKYIFTKKEWTRYFRSTISDPSNPPQITAWYLTKIIHPLGDEVYISYQANSYQYISSITQIVNKTIPFSGSCGSISCPPASESITTYRNTSRITGYSISGISSNNQTDGYISFEYQAYPGTPNDETVSGNFQMVKKIKVVSSYTDLIDSYTFDYYTTPNSRVFLSSIQYLDYQKKYTFEYIDPDMLCKRLSYSQDYWGYYNGIINQYFVPDDYSTFFSYYGNRNPVNDFSQKGLLKKIIYPTKGSTSFNYESNTIHGTKTIYPPKVSLALEVQTNDEQMSDVDTVTTDTILFNQDVLLNCYSVSANYYCAGCSTAVLPPVIKARLTVYDVSVSPPVPINILQKSNTMGAWMTAGTAVDLYETMVPYMVNLQAGKKYKFELKVNKWCLLANLTFNYYNQIINTIETDIETGGSRIKKITNYDPVANKQNIIRYYYNRFEELDKSSGDESFKGNYFYKKWDRTPCPLPCEYIDCPSFLLISSSQKSLMNQNNNIFYRFVTLSYGGDNFENGGETREFIINRDVLGNILNGDNSMNVWSNVGWNHGKLKSIETFKKVNSLKVPLNIQKFSYQKNCMDTLYSYSVSKNFELICTQSHHHICTPEEALKKEKKIDCITEHKHIYHIGSKGIWFRFEFWEGCFGPHVFWYDVGLESVCVACGANNVEYWEYDRCFDRAGDTLVYSNMIENLNIVEYSNYSWNTWLDSTINIQYDQNGLNPISTYTHYCYDNPFHSQLSRKYSTNSKGESIEELYYYPADYLGIGSFDTLNSKNVLSPIIDTRKNVNNKLIFAKNTNYNINGQPTEVKYSDNEIGTSLPWYNDNPYSYGYLNESFAYDQNTNNLLTYYKAYDKPVSYSWGYGENLLIAVTQNSMATEMGYTGFENGESNGWTLPPTTNFVHKSAFPLDVKLGEASVSVANGNGPLQDFYIPGNLTQNGYTASVWVKGNKANIKLVALVDNIWNSAFVISPTLDNVWEQLKVNIPKTYVNGFLINGGSHFIRVYVINNSPQPAFIDELKFFPSDAQMTTYNHKPMFGVSTITDPNDRTTYYEYDNLGRLNIIRDQDNNIIKKYIYNYSNH